jgi:hypothetical protein
MKIDLLRAVQHQQHTVFLAQLAHLLDGFRRRIGVIVRYEVDLAAVDAPLIVQHPEIR